MLTVSCSQDASGIARYMSPYNRRDFLDAALSAIAARKVAGVPRLLLNRWRRNQHLLAQLQKDFEDAKHEANSKQSGGTQDAGNAADTQDAGASLERYAILINKFLQYAVPGQAVVANPEDKMMEYVKCRIQMQAAEVLGKGGKELVAVSASLTAKLLLANSKSISTVTRKADNLERQLGIDGSWNSRQRLSLDNQQLQPALTQLVKREQDRYVLCSCLLV